MREMIQLKKLAKSFGNIDVISDLTMTVKQGEIYGFLGENGAGKTTVMKMILNLIKPTAGEIQIAGEKVNNNSYKYLSQIGSVIEYPVFYETLSALKNLELHCQYLNKGTGFIEDVLQMTGLYQERSKVVGEYSLGMRQRLGIARAIVTKPKVLLLDEPMNGLDPIGIHDVRVLLQKIKEEWQTAILISSHIVSEMETLADKVGILYQGKITAETKLSDLNGSNLEQYFMEVIQKGRRV